MAWQVKTLKDAYTPVLWLNCIFCMGIFEIPINRPRPFLTLIYIILIGMGYFAMFYKILKQHILYYEDYEFMSFLVIGINVLSATSSVILFWYNTKYRQSINIIIKRLSIADDTLNVLSVKKNYRKVFNKVLTYLIFWILCLILLHLFPVLRLVHRLDYIEVISISIFSGFTAVLTTMADLTFCLFLRYLRINFQNMNDLMNEVLFFINEADTFRNHIQRKNKLTTVVRNNYENNKEKIKHLMQTLKQLHLEFTRIGHLINNTYCMQLLFELAVHFTIITTAIYYMYFYIAYKNLDNEIFIKATVWMIWGFASSFKVILFNNLCSKTSNEANKTVEIVQSFGRCIFHKELQEEIHQFTQQIALSPLYFNASGFFLLNNGLTGKFFATVMTYVVILIQFSSGYNKVSRCHC